MDWPSYASYALIGLAVALSYVFLSAVLKPIGKHFGSRATKWLEERGQERSFDRRAPANQVTPKAETSAGAGRPGLEAVKSLLMALIEAVGTTVGGFNAVLAGGIILASVVFAWLMGLDPAPFAVGTSVGIIMAGTAQFVRGRRKLRALGAEPDTPR